MEKQVGIGPNGRYTEYTFGKKETADLQKVSIKMKSRSATKRVLVKDGKGLFGRHWVKIRVDFIPRYDIYDEEGRNDRLYVTIKEFGKDTTYEVSPGRTSRAI